MENLYKQEVNKLGNLLNELKDTDLKKDKINYMIIKLQELNFDLKLMIDEINELHDIETTNKMNNYVSNELDRRTKIDKLLPLYTLLYFSVQ